MFSLEKEIKEIVTIAKLLHRENFHYIKEMYVHELIEYEETDIDEKDLEEMIDSSYFSDESQENFNLNSLDTGLQMAFPLTEHFTNIDPIFERSVK